MPAKMIDDWPHVSLSSMLDHTLELLPDSKAWPVLAKKNLNWKLHLCPRLLWLTILIWKEGRDSSAYFDMKVWHLLPLSCLWVFYILIGWLIWELVCLFLGRRSLESRSWALLRWGKRLCVRNWLGFQSIYCFFFGSFYVCLCK